MNIYGATLNEWDKFLQNPEAKTFILKDTDIVARGKDELLNIFSADSLKSGFELSPPLNIDDPKFADDIRKLGHAWDWAIIKIYQLGGTITYREMENGLFEAVVNIQVKPPL